MTGVASSTIDAQLAGNFDVSDASNCPGGCANFGVCVGTAQEDICGLWVDTDVEEASLYDRYIEYFQVEDENKVSDEFLKTGEPISAWEHSLIEVIDEFFYKWAD